MTERIGLDLILPVAAMLPLERHLRWVRRQQIGAKVAEDLLAGVGDLATALSGRAKFAGAVGRVAGLIGRGVNSVATDLGADQLRKLHAAALAKHDHMAAVLSRFALDLDDAEERRILLRSRK